jgi:hypothetical protein
VNRVNSFIFQFGTKQGKTNTNRLQPLHCNVVILFDITVGGVLKEIKDEIVIIIVWEKSSIKSKVLKLIVIHLKLKPVFIFEILKTDRNNNSFSGTYSYFCFLCGSIQIPIDEPSISRSGFIFSELWAPFSILISSLDPIGDTNRKYWCNQRPVNFMTSICK